jgi:hypothetical protein
MRILLMNHPRENFAQKTLQLTTIRFAVTRSSIVGLDRVEQVIPYPERFLIPEDFALF